MERKQIDDLIDLIYRKLKFHGFVEIDRDVSDEIIAIIKTPRIWTVRYVCPIIKPPSNVSECDSFRDYLRNIRKVVSKRYAKFPWFKEIGILSVILVENPLFDKISKSNISFVDKTGLHVSTFCSMSILNTSDFRVFSQRTWGIYKSIAYFGTIMDILEEFAEANK